MLSKDALVSVGYGMVSFLLMPIFVIGVGLSLFLYAVVAELGGLDWWQSHAVRFFRGT